MRALSLSLFLMCVLSSGAWAAVDDSQAKADFTKAGELYRAGDYSGAIASYEKILDNGMESGPLYYNLANSYYRDGQIGEAVLNYERATQLIPRDRDLKYNDRYLRSRYPDARPYEDKNIFEKSVDKHIEFYTLDEMAAVLAGLLIVSGLFFLAAFYRRWARSTVMTASMVMAGAIGIYAAGFVFKLADVANKAVAIKKASANFEPRSNATEHFLLPEGAIVKILKEENGWMKIRRWDNQMGWVPADSIERMEIHE